MNKKELKNILDKHLRYLQGYSDGKRADLSCRDLRGENLSNVNLRDANLRHTILCGADLRGANFEFADLFGANLKLADVRGTNFKNSDLRKTYFLGAKFDKIEYIRQEYSILPEGDIIGYKKISGCLIKLLIPEKAKRVNALSSRKCRAEYADVLEITEISSGKKKNSIKGGHDSNFVYTLNERIFPDSYNDSCLEECTNGIHFFITKVEAEEYY